jgi:hypothetical protein
LFQQIITQAEQVTLSAKERTEEARSRLSVRQRDHEISQSKLDAEIAEASQPAFASQQEQATTVSSLQTEIDTLRCTKSECLHACCYQADDLVCWSFQSSVNRGVSRRRRAIS